MLGSTNSESASFFKKTTRILELVSLDDTLQLTGGRLINIFGICGIDSGRWLPSLHRLTGITDFDGAQKIKIAPTFYVFYG